MTETKHLKSRQHYLDLYDRHTVDECRRIERINAEVEIPESEDSEPISQEEKERAKNYVGYLHLYFTKGERCINKDKTIQEWMDRDQKRDEFYEFAEPPEDIRCLTCRNRLKVSSKLYWSGIDGKPDRILFMFDCPNQCLPHRAFYSDGEEYRVKVDLCPNCNIALDKKSEDDCKKHVTTFTCSKCAHTHTEEFEWSTPAEEKLDESFVKDRDRFCITEEEGKKYQEEKWNLERIKPLMEEIKKEEEERAAKLAANPKGFITKSGRGCAICGEHNHEGEYWYDEHGYKCLVCQKAIDEGEILASFAKDKEGWYSKWELERAFNIKGPTLRSWVRKGIIKPRVISQYGKGVHAEIFLVEDNKDFVPPKQMVESKSGRWYQFVDPVEHLKGYKTMEHLRVVPAEEMKAREEADKKKQEERRKRWEDKQARKKRPKK